MVHSQVRWWEYGSIKKQEKNDDLFRIQCINLPNNLKKHVFNSETRTLQFYPHKLTQLQICSSLPMTFLTHKIFPFQTELLKMSCWWKHNHRSCFFSSKSSEYLLKYCVTYWLHFLPSFFLIIFSAFSTIVFRTSSSILFIPFSFPSSSIA